MDAQLQRELEHHERLYSGFAQQHFHKKAVRAFRRDLVARILRLSGADSRTRVLSLGCGIGDTELLLAPQVREVVGVDLSPSGIRQARQSAAELKLENVCFVEGSPEQLGAECFDLVIAIFFLHHLSGSQLGEFPTRLRALLAPRGVFYSLDPSKYRLSGAIGNLLFPALMKKYQTPDERQLVPRLTAELFRQAGFDCEFRFYDFVSTPLAGLFPDWQAGYRLTRWLDNLLVRIPGLRALGSNFEVVARGG